MAGFSKTYRKPQWDGVLLFEVSTPSLFCNQIWKPLSDGFYIPANNKYARPHPPPPSPEQYYGFVAEGYVFIDVYTCGLGGVASVLDSNEMLERAVFLLVWNTHFEGKTDMH